MMKNDETPKEELDILKIYEEVTEELLPPDDGFKFAFKQLYTLLLSM